MGRKKKPPLQCRHCGKDFPYRAGQRFCSRSCSKFKDLPTKVCVECGQEFRKNTEYSYAVWDSIRFCSLKCRGSGKPARFGKCRTCGGDFQIMSGSKGRKHYCSQECYWESLRVIVYPLKHRASGEFSRPIKRHIFERDGGKCRWCGTTENLEFDHFIPMFVGGPGTPDNGRLLCRACHLRKTLMERPKRHG